jgi:hypothetical protein
VIKSFLSVGSERSVLSFGSVDSVLSFLSEGSVLSFASKRSVLSFGSVDSVLSFLSEDAFGSVLCVGSRSVCPRLFRGVDLVAHAMAHATGALQALRETRPI